MRTYAFLLLVLLLMVPALSAQDVSYLPQAGDGQFGQILRLITEFIFVNSGAPTQAKLTFKLPNGTPMALNLEGIGSVTEHNFALARGQSVSFKTMGVGAPNVGYAVLTAGGPLAGGGGATGVGGTGVFIQIDIPSGTVINEAGVPLVKELSAFSLFVDTQGSRNTALAIVNPAGSGVLGGGGGPIPAARLNLFDKSFNFIATTDVPIPPGEQRNNFIAGYFDPEQVPEVNDMCGSVTVTPVSVLAGGVAPPPMAGLTVRTNNLGTAFPAAVPTFTPFPVIPGAAALLDAGVSGTVSLESEGLNISLDLRDATRLITGAVFFVFDRGQLIAEVVRPVRTTDVLSFFLDLPGTRASLTRLGVEVRLIYGGGEISPLMPIE